MYLFIANTSKQHHDFLYRLEGEKLPRLEKIPIGQQAKLPVDLTTEQIASVIAQHAAYNIVDANSISNIKEFVGICYRIGKPVSMDNMLVLFEQNDSKLNDRAAQVREDNATAIAAKVEERFAEMGARVRRTEVEMRTENDGGTGDEIAEGVEITAEGVPPVHGGKRGHRNGGRNNRRVDA